MNTKEKGDNALAYAINYYLTHGYEVCLPVGDKRSYDLLIEKEGIIQRVQVKYAGFYRQKNQCLVGLRITGGNQSYHYAKKYHDDAFDILFVYTERGTKYHIPWKKIRARSEISIEHQKYNKFMIKNEEPR